MKSRFKSDSDYVICCSVKRRTKCWIKHLAVILFAVCITIFAEISFAKQQCYQLFQSEKSFAIETFQASGTVMILDTNIAQNFIISKLLGFALIKQKTSVLRAQFMDLIDKISSGVLEEEQLYRSSKYGLEKVRQGIITETQYKLARMEGRISTSGPSTFLALLGEKFEGQTDFKFRITPAILTEIFKSEFDLEGKNLVWRGPETILRDLLGTGTMADIITDEAGIIGGDPSASPLAVENFLHKVESVALGGRNGQADQKIAAEIKFANLAPGTKVGFATADINLIRGLLRLHFESISAADSALEKMRKGSRQSVLSIHEGVEESSFPFNSHFADWRHQTQKRGRMVVFKGLNMGDGRTIDLYGFFQMDSGAGPKGQ